MEERAEEYGENKTYKSERRRLTGEKDTNNKRKNNKKKRKLVKNKE
ncbi:hypothetical protein [Listeria monocytogenes]|nr:hypothetical protein [Listeria monocytogenes]